MDREDGRQFNTKLLETLLKKVEIHLSFLRTAVCDEEEFEEIKSAQETVELMFHLLEDF